MSKLVIKAGRHAGGEMTSWMQTIGEVAFNTVGIFPINGNLLELFLLPSEALKQSAKTIQCNVRLRQRWHGDQQIGDTLSLKISYKFDDGVNPPINTTLFECDIVAENDTNIAVHENQSFVINIPNSGFPDLSYIDLEVSQTGTFQIDADVLINSVSYES